jgi:signal transduction histidine kinase
MPLRMLDQRLDRLRSPSLRVRLTLWTVAVSLVIQSVLGAVVFFYQRRAADGEFSARLAHRVDAAAKALARVPEAPGSRALERAAAEAMFFPNEERFALALLDDAGRVRAMTGHADLAPGDALPDASANPPGTRAWRVHLPALREPDDPDDVARVVFRPLPGGRGTLLAATTDKPFEEMVRLTARTFLLVLPVGVLGTGFAAWLISGLALAPLRELREMTRSLFPETIRQDVGFPSTHAEFSSFQRDLADARGRLQQAFRAQDRLIANLSHELKTPIAVLLIEASTLQSTDLSPEAREFVTSVQHEMRHLGKILEGFLLLSKAQGGQRISSGRRCDMNDLVVEAVRAAGAAGAERRIATTTRLCESDTLPVVQGDPEMLRSLFEQLIRAAIAVSPEGQGVSVEIDATGTSCRVCVRDRGPSLPESSMAQVFDWFTESSTHCSDRRTPGLAVAKGIAELHGGRVIVRNVDGGGCDFIVELPLAHAPRSASDPAEPGASSPGW